MVERTSSAVKEISDATMRHCDVSLLGVKKTGGGFLYHVGPMYKNIKHSLKVICLC